LNSVRKVGENVDGQQEGYMRKHFHKDGQFIDARLFALLKDE
jgi:RimJ/RimL family protein N-acetyltransferase